LGQPARGDYRHYLPASYAEAHGERHRVSHEHGPSSWHTYLSRLLDFVDSPESGLFPSLAEYAGLNCRDLVDTSAEGSRICTAVLTTKNYLFLRNFGYPV
jgi:hypothetical protein